MASVMVLLHLLLITVLGDRYVDYDDLVSRRWYCDENMRKMTKKVMKSLNMMIMSQGVGIVMKI